MKFNFIHKEMAAGEWKKFSCVMQMANIGSEVFRAIDAREKNDERLAQSAFIRALELFDLTLQDKKNFGRLKEIGRSQEIFADYFANGNEYHSTAKQWQDYFYQFNYLARLQKLAL